MNQKAQLKLVQNLVGPVSANAFLKMRKKVEMYLIPEMGIFIPYLDYCDYAISPQHTHPAYSFIYNFTGPAEVNVGRERKSSPFGTRPNICAFSPHLPHEEIVQDQFHSYIAVLISKPFFEKELNHYPKADRKPFAGDYFPASEPVLNILKRFMTEHDEPLPGRDKLLKALALEATHLLIRHCLRYETSAPKISNKIEINQLIQHLNERFADKITVTAMAKYIHMSVSHFSRIFKKETGMTPTDFLINLRVQKARRYLMHKTPTVTEIAHTCGFSSSAYFATCFTERMGLTPTDYRKRQTAQ